MLIIPQYRTFWIFGFLLFLAPDEGSSQQVVQVQKQMLWQALLQDAGWMEVLRAKVKGLDLKNLTI